MHKNDGRDRPWNGTLRRHARCRRPPPPTGSPVELLVAAVHSTLGPGSPATSSTAGRLRGQPQSAHQLRSLKYSAQPASAFAARTPRGLRRARRSQVWRGPPTELQRRRRRRPPPLAAAAQPPLPTESPPAPCLPRMGAHIESLKLKAFKSVGAAWLEVPFQRGLNAVVGARSRSWVLLPPFSAAVARATCPRPAPTTPTPTPPTHPAGPNGCGKSSLLDALLFVSAAPFAAASLAALPCTDCSEVCEVRLTLRAQGGQLHTVAAALTPDGSRAYKVDGRWVAEWREVGGLTTAAPPCCGLSLSPQHPSTCPTTPHSLQSQGPEWARGARLPALPGPLPRFPRRRHQAGRRHAAGRRQQRRTPGGRGGRGVGAR